MISIMSLKKVKVIIIKLYSIKWLKHYNMLHNLCLPHKPRSKSIAQLANILQEKYDCLGLESTIRYICYRRMQSENETGTEYFAALQKNAQKCNFAYHTENACRNQLIVSIQNKNIRNKLLCVSNLTYERTKVIFL